VPLLVVTCLFPLLFSYKAKPNDNKLSSMYMYTTFNKENGKTAVGNWHLQCTSTLLL